MYTINSQLSPELQVAPLKEGEVVTFRLLKKGEIDPSTGEPYVLSDYWQVGKEQIYDPFAQKQVLLLNTEGEKPEYDPVMKNYDRMAPNVVSIKWVNGDVILSNRDFEAICYLRRSNKNKSNPWRNPAKKAIFEEVSNKKLKLDAAIDDDLELKARLWARDASLDQIKGVAKHLDIIEPDEAILIAKVRGIAKKDPRAIILASQDKEAKAMVQIIDALKYDVMVLDEDTNTFFWKDNLQEITQVDAGVDQRLGLLQYYQKGGKDGRAAYAKMCKYLKDIYSAAGVKA